MRRSGLRKRQLWKKERNPCFMRLSDNNLVFRSTNGSKTSFWVRRVFLFEIASLCWRRDNLFVEALIQHFLFKKRTRCQCGGHTAILKELNLVGIGACDFHTGKMVKIFSWKDNIHLWQEKLQSSLRDLENRHSGGRFAVQVTRLLGTDCTVIARVRVELQSPSGRGFFCGDNKAKFGVQHLLTCSRLLESLLAALQQRGNISGLNYDTLVFSTFFPALVAKINRLWRFPERFIFQLFYSIFIPKKWGLILASNLVVFFLSVLDFFLLFF